MNSPGLTPSGPYAWWISIPIATRAAIKSALVSFGTTAGLCFTVLYGAYLPGATDQTLGGFLAWLPAHWFGTLGAVAIVWFRTHAGYNRAVNPTATTIPNPNAK